MKTCCFIGHRNVEGTPELRERLKDVVRRLITEKGVSRFLFGSKSLFDDLCHEVVTKLREEYPQIRRVYVRTYYTELGEQYTKYLLKSYEDTYLPEGVEKAGRAAYVERNQEMIKASEYCVFYYDENYKPKERKYSRRNLTYYQPKSGTEVAYEYAKRKGKEIINLKVGECELKS
ncbi:MAG: DUF1273 domain-containing protein [Clostridiales bacterium]|nr:DUF1273 domain-containing protein [Clostridiales bacterium]